MAGKNPVDIFNEIAKVAPKTVNKQRCEDIKKKLSLREGQLKKFNKAVATAKADPTLQKRSGTVPILLVGAPYTTAVIGYTSEQIKIQRAKMLADINGYKREYEQSGCQTSKNNGNGGGGGGGSNKPTVEKSKDMIYNVGSVKESYFKQGESLVNVPNGATNQPPTKLDAYLYEANTPTQVADANELWKGAVASKGMIQSWSVPNSRPTGADSYLNDGTSVWSSDVFKQKYGFQFQYNPTSVSMSYSGVGEVDPAMEASGSEDFNLLTSTTTQSAISFDLLINRMNDLKYLTSPGKLRPGVEASKWAGRTPEAEDFKQIYNKGTMYDIEYLLKTLLGFELPTQFRGKSADIGFVSPRPVELHLGKSLRYVGTINEFSVTHAIFDWRMVPLFSNLRITFNRIPDYGGFNAAIDGASSGGSGSTNSPTSGVDPNSYGPGKIPTAALG